MQCKIMISDNKLQNDIFSLLRIIKQYCLALPNKDEATYSSHKSTFHSHLPVHDYQRASVCIIFFFVAKTHTQLCNAMQLSSPHPPFSFLLSIPGPTIPSIDSATAPRCTQAVSSSSCLIGQRRHESGRRTEVRYTCLMRNYAGARACGVLSLSVLRLNMSLQVPKTKKKTGITFRKGCP